MNPDDFIVEFAAYQHPKFDDAGPAASWLWLQCGLWSRHEKSDGFVPTSIVRKNGTVAQAKRLVVARLWTEEEGGFRFLLWRNHMGSPETAAKERRRDRDREYRRNRRAQQKGDTSPVGVVGTLSAPTSARQSADVVPTAERLDTASSLEVPPLSPPQGEAQPAAAPAPRPPAKRKTALPKSWTPIERHREFAVEHRLDLAGEAARFREHHEFRGTLGVDWSRGFDTWLRNAVKFRDADAAKQPQPKGDPNAWMNR